MQFRDRLRGFGAPAPAGSPDRPGRLLGQVGHGTDPLMVENFR
jgi:hypothetical protein